VNSDDFVGCNYISCTQKLGNDYTSDFVVCGVTNEDESGIFLGRNGNDSCETLNPKDAFFLHIFWKEYLLLGIFKSEIYFLFSNIRDHMLRSMIWK